MGTIIKNIFPCLHEDKKLGRINKNELSGSFGDFINTSNGEFFCHKCSAKTPEIAEILKIHSDNGKILIFCPKDEKTEELTLTKYFEKIKNNDIYKCRHSNCSNKNDNINNELNYCQKCGHFLCDDCSVKDEKKFMEKINILRNNSKCGFCCCLCCFGGNKYKDKYFHVHIKKNELSIKCSIHNLKTKNWCLECQKYVCEKCLKEFHKRHKTKEIDLNKIEEKKKIIEKKDDKLKKMIEFYELVNSAYESNHSNNIYKKNVNNVAESIKREEKRDNYDIDLALYKLRKIRKQNEKEKQKKEELKKKKNIQVMIV